MSNKQSETGKVTDNAAYIPLSQAPNVVPGRPAINAIWRWCRLGVKSRSGERVRLEHRRVGGKIYTTQAWIDSFLSQITDADKSYFSHRQSLAGAQTASPTSRYSSPATLLKEQRRKTTATARSIDAETEAALDEEGL